MIEQFNNILNSFNIKATCVGANTHRHFAFYDVELLPGTRISKLQRYSEELAIALRANSSLIIKPISKKGIVRLQTTTTDPEKLDFYKLYDSIEKPEGVLSFLIGETEEGKPLFLDIARNPHMLMAGSTGSGKSVTLHTIIANAAERLDIKLFLVDTKRVEFSAYANGNLPHVVESVSNTCEEAMDVLEYLNSVMELRYEHMAKLGVKNIEERPNMFTKMILIIDEAADLMLGQPGKRFESLVAKLAQKARAAGIFMIFATQRPSVDVFTGIIKANFPARLSCKVTSKVDSKVILDRMGAEKLIGRGDAILNNSCFDMTRFQVAYVEPKTIISRSRSESENI